MDSSNPSTTTLSVLSYSYAMIGDIKNALKLFKGITSQKKEPKKIAFRGILVYYEKRKMFRESFIYFNTMYQRYNYAPTRFHIHSLVNCTPLERLEEIFNLVIENQWIHIDTNFVNMFISRAGDLSSFSTCEHFFHLMSSNLNLSPCEESYRFIIDKALQCGELEKMKKYFKEMEEKGFLDVSSNISYNNRNSWIELYFKTPRLEKKLDYIGTKKKVFLQHAYSNLIGNLSYLEGSFDKCFSLYKELQRLKISPGNAIVRPLISLCGKNKKQKILYQLISDIPKNRCDLNYLIANIVSAFCDLGLVGDAIHYFNKISKKKDIYSENLSDLFDDVSEKYCISICSIISYYSSRGSHEKVEEWKQKAIDLGVFEIRIANIVLEHYMKYNFLEKMESLFISFDDFLIVPDDLSFSYAFSLLSSQDLEGLLSLFEIMIQVGISNLSDQHPLSVSLSKHLSSPNIYNSFVDKLNEYDVSDNPSRNIVEIRKLIEISKKI